MKANEIFFSRVLTPAMDGAFHRTDGRHRGLISCIEPAGTNQHSYLLSLTLFVLGVLLVDYIQATLTANDLVVGRALFDRSSNFHCCVDCLSVSVELKNHCLEQRSGNGLGPSGRQGARMPSGGVRGGRAGGITCNGKQFSPLKGHRATFLRELYPREES